MVWLTVIVVVVKVIVVVVTRLNHYLGRFFFVIYTWGNK